MKLIALRDFRKVPSISLDLKDMVNSSHVHKGAIFDIGQGRTLKDCNNYDKDIIARLTVAGCVGDATDEKVVANVKEEIEISNKQEAARAKATSFTFDATLGAQLMAALQKMAMVPGKAN